MWIESIDIRGFGCLTDRRYEFQPDRAALIIADNETGKSTLAAAILAALCGFAKQTTKDGRQRRAAHKPWHGDVYAIAMDISADGKRLRIERDFARNTFVVRDRDTGNDVSARYESDLAAHFLHLPHDDFRRIAFVCGKDSPSLEQTGGIQARLSALVDGSTDDTAAEPAIAALDGARYTLDTGGPLLIETAIKRLTESIVTTRKQIDDLETELDTAGNDVAKLDNARSQLADAKNRLDRLDSEFEEARRTEEETRAREVERARVEAAIVQSEANLAAIDQRRAYGRKLGSAIVVLGVLLALANCGLWLGQALAAAPGVIGALVGIAVAAFGAVHVVKSQFTDADKRLALQREIADARTLLSSLPVRSRECSRSSADIDAERRRLRVQIDALNETINELERSVGVRVGIYKSKFPELRDRLRTLERERAKAERFRKAIDVARSVLTELAEGSRRRWAAALNQTASAILQHLNPNYDNLLFDDTLAFTIRHIPDDRILQPRDIDACLSTGAKDQIYLAVRLACCEELSRGEQIPVILDDPLMTADDSRFASGFRYLVETYAKKRQVIILSCSRARHERLAGEDWFGENVHFIELESPHASAPAAPS